jgi:hypothetical protein
MTNYRYLPFRLDPEVSRRRLRREEKIRTREHRGCGTCAQYAKLESMLFCRPAMVGGRGRLGNAIERKNLVQ